MKGRLLWLNFWTNSSDALRNSSVFATLPCLVEPIDRNHTQAGNPFLSIADFVAANIKDSQMKLYSTLFTSVMLAANSDAGSGGNSEDVLAGVTANTKAQFVSIMDKLVKSIGSTQKLSREAAEMAFTHFCAHGDACYFQMLTDKMAKHAKNYFRADALVAWATTFAPLKFEKGKWTKDKDRAEAMNWPKEEVVVEIDGKKVKFDQVSFWDFSAALLGRQCQ